jgi:predicted component of viral defense system (DUF524 family)
VWYCIINKNNLEKSSSKNYNKVLIDICQRKRKINVENLTKNINDVHFQIRSNTFLPLDLSEQQIEKIFAELLLLEHLEKIILKIK